MTKIEKFKAFYETIIGTVVSIACVYVLNNYQEDLPKNQTMKGLFVVIFVSIFIILLNKLVASIIDTSKWLRRLIDPSSFIEGYWYDITYDQSGNFVHLVFLTIKYQNSIYTLCGETFDKNGKKVSTFNSTHSNFSNHELLAVVTSKYTGRTLDRALDYFNFTQTADSYEGFYIDINTNKLVDISGTKILQNEIKKFKGLKTLNDKANFAKSKV